MTPALTDDQDPATVGPYRRRSKVVVLKWQQHKRPATDGGPPEAGGRLTSSNQAAVNHGEGSPEGTKRRRIHDLDSNSASTRPTGNPDDNKSVGDCDVAGSEDPIVGAHRHSPSQAATERPNATVDSLGPKEQPPVTGSDASSATDRIPRKEQASPGQGEPKVGLPFLVWLLDPRPPGWSLELWGGPKPLSLSVLDVFDETTKLLGSDEYDGIQFSFKLDNQAGEWKFPIRRGASEAFQIMKENAPKKMKQAMDKSGKKAKAVELTLKPLGLVEAASSKGATTEAEGDQEGYGIDALFA